MRTWQRRMIGILTLAGSGAGLAAVLQTMFGERSTISALIVYVAALSVYVIGIIAGVSILEGSRKFHSLAVLFWALQIPFLASPWLSYRFFSGIQLDVVLTLEPDLQFKWAVGSFFHFFLLPGEQVALGVNLVAIYVLRLLLKTPTEAGDQEIG